MLFLFLFLQAQFTGEDILKYPVNLFLRLDPFLALTSFISARAVIDAFLISGYVIVLTLLLGRVWCGWICPMGTTLDILHKVFFKNSKRLVDSQRFRRLKYYLFFFLIVTSAFSLQLAGFFDPISLLTRTVTLSLYPALNVIFEKILIAGYNVDISWISELSDNLYIILKENYNLIAFKQPVYYLNFFTFFIFFLIVFLEKYEKRFWCKNLCPAGAMLSLLSPFSLIRRRPRKQCPDCEHGCDAVCKLALFPGGEPEDYIKKECIYCFDCIENCPNGRVKYSFGIRRKKKKGVDLTRRGLILSLGAGAVALPLLRVNPLSDSPNLPPRFIRPPGTLDTENKFLAKCERCGECMRVCVNNAIQPAFFEAGAESLWTPKIVPRIGACAFNCTLCGQVCPSGAIKELSLKEKHTFVIGKAFFDKNRCIPYAKKIDCIVCEEHCPTLPKAIKFKEVTVTDDSGVKKKIKHPYVDEALCIGCGICENKCPLEKEAGIIVFNQKKVIKEGYFISNVY